MTDENRKEQEKQDELTEKDLDQASGGAPRAAALNRQEGRQKLEGSGRK